MVAFTLVQRLTPNIALVIGAVLAVLVTLTVGLLPGVLLEDVVLASGIAAFVPGAEPPLGMTARISAAVTAGGGIGLFSWFALSVLSGIMGARRDDAAGRPVVRRADAHPDAPPRQPLRAGRDFGYDLAETPVTEAPVVEEPLELVEPAFTPEPVIAMGAPEPIPVPAPVVVAGPPPVQALPADLDQPLAAFDPAAVPETPLPVPARIEPIRRRPVYEASERFETFELTPVRSAAATAQAAPTPIATPETAASVHALLDRLERGIARRGTPAPVPPAPGGLEATLYELRRMAARA